MPKKMSREERAEYMRVYRARKRGLRPDEPAGKTGVSETLDVSGGLPPIIDVDLGAQVAEARARLAAEFGPTPPPDFRPMTRIRPSFLAAPNDDCAACGHDRHAYHLDGPCKAPALTRSKRCGCTDYVSAAEPF